MNWNYLFSRGRRPGIMGTRGWRGHFAMSICIFASVVLLAGIFASVLFINSTLGFRRRAEPVVGVVQGIHSAMGRRSAWVYYDVDGRGFAQFLDYQSGMYQGMEVHFFYDTANPHNIALGRGRIPQERWPLVIVIIGALLLRWGVLMYLRQPKDIIDTEDGGEPPSVREWINFGIYVIGMIVIVIIVLNAELSR